VTAVPAGTDLIPQDRQLEQWSDVLLRQAAYSLLAALEAKSWMCSRIGVFSDLHMRWRGASSFPQASSVTGQVYR